MKVEYLKIVEYPKIKVEYLKIVEYPKIKAEYLKIVEYQQCFPATIFFALPLRAFTTAFCFVLWRARGALEFLFLPYFFAIFIS